MKKINEIDFETAIEQLENLVREMEQGTLPIEQAMQAYEKAISLVRRCEELLSGYQQKITTLKRNGDKIIEVEFSTKGE